MPHVGTAASRRLRLRGLAANLALAAFAIAATLLAAEAGVRALTRTPPALLQSDPLVGKRFRPGFAGKVFVPECGCEVALRFDREGLRGPERPRAIAKWSRRCSNSVRPPRSSATRATAIPMRSAPAIRFDFSSSPSAVCLRSEPSPR